MVSPLSPMDSEFSASISFYFMWELLLSGKASMRPLRIVSVTYDDGRTNSINDQCQRLK